MNTLCQGWDFYDTTLFLHRLIVKYFSKYQYDNIKQGHFMNILRNKVNVLYGIKCTHELRFLIIKKWVFQAKRLCIIKMSNFVS